MPEIRLRRPEPITDERRAILREALSSTGRSPFAPRPTLQEIYIQCMKEAGGPAAFAELMGTEMYRTLTNSFNRWSGSNWRKVVDVINVKDFRAHRTAWLSGAEEFLKVGKAGKYEDSRMFDHEFSITADTYGRKFILDRHTIMNDDLNALQKWPQAAGIAAAQKISKMVWWDIFYANANAFDGGALFNNARTTPAGVTVDNLDLNTALTEANLEAAVAKFLKFRDHDTGEPLGIRPKYLCVCTDLAMTADRIVGSAERIGATTADALMGNKNPLFNGLEIIVEPYMDVNGAVAAKTAVTGAWMLLPDPQDVPVASVAALNGVLEPDLLVKTEAYNLSGGADPYAINVDEMEYKARIDAGVGVGSYHAYAATAAATWPVA